MASSVLPVPSAPMVDTSSMLSSVPADFFSAASDIPEPVAEGAGEDAPPDAPIEALAETPAEVDEPAVEEPEVEEPISSEPADENAEPVVDPAAAPPADEELPEGTLRTKDAKGKFKYSLDENRYRTIYGNHQLVQQATEILNEPLTAEALTLRNDAYLGQERLFTNLTSADPALQADVVNYFLNEMKSEHESGAVGTDPSVPFAETVYNSLREKSPDGYAHLRMQAARDFLGEMYELAARTGDLAVGHSAQHIARALAGIGPKPAEMSEAQYLQQVRDVTGRSQIPFFTPEEFQGLARGEDPAAALQRENAELKARLNGNPAPNVQAEQYNTWNRSHTQDVNTAVFEKAVKPALASIEEGWKPFPSDYQDLVVDRLNRLVSKDVREDAGLNQRITDLQGQARRATSEQVRTRIGESIKQLVVNRANIAAAKYKPAVAKFAADALQGRSAQTHARKAVAQTRTAPQGQSTPVKTSAVPTPVAQFKNGVFDSTTAMKQAMAVMNGR